jgi:hypothetical protein
MRTVHDTCLLYMMHAAVYDVMLHIYITLQGRDGQDGSTPIILIILDDEHAQQMRTAGEEVKARGADVIIITDNPKLAEVRKGKSKSSSSSAGCERVVVPVAVALACVPL